MHVHSYFNIMGQLSRNGELVMNYEFIFVVFSLTLVVIVAIVFGKDDIAKTAVAALAHRFEDTIKTVGQIVKRLTP